MAHQPVGPRRHQLARLHHDGEGALERPHPPEGEKRRRRHQQEDRVKRGGVSPYGGMGRREEVTGIYQFLASDAASFITGQEICVDGGLTAGLGQPLLGAAAVAG